MPAKGVWRTRLNGSGFGPQYSGEAQPIYFDGTLYVSTGANDVFAIDVDSGKFLWTYQANLDPAISTACLAGAPIVRPRQLSVPWWR